MLKSIALRLSVRHRILLLTVINTISKQRMFSKYSQMALEWQCEDKTDNSSPFLGSTNVFIVCFVFRNA